MIKRKKNLILIQLFLFMIGLCVIFYTYYISKKSDEIITLENRDKISDQLSQQNDNGNDIFYNIKYSGIDLAGNRYILTSKEAINNNNNPELVNMKFVEVNFYFKDETVLNVFSDEGIYNNKTLDMVFEKNVN